MDVSFCGIIKVDGIEKLSNLKFLDLSKNQIKSLPTQEIIGLQLACFRLDKNPIDSLSEDLVDYFKVIRQLIFGFNENEIETWEEQDYFSCRTTQFPTNLFIKMTTMEKRNRDYSRLGRTRPRHKNK